MRGVWRGRMLSSLRQLTTGEILYMVIIAALAATLYTVISIIEPVKTILERQEAQQLAIIANQDLNRQAIINLQENRTLEDLNRENQSAVAFIPWLVDIEEDQDVTNNMLRAFMSKDGIDLTNFTDAHSVVINGTHVIVDNNTKIARMLPFGVVQLYDNNSTEATTGNSTANILLSQRPSVFDESYQHN